MKNMFSITNSLLCAGALLLAACSQQDESPAPTGGGAGGGEIRFTTFVKGETRAAGNAAGLIDNSNITGQTALLYGARTSESLREFDWNTSDFQVFADVELKYNEGTHSWETSKRAYWDDDTQYLFWAFMPTVSQADLAGNSVAHEVFHSEAAAHLPAVCLPEWQLVTLGADGKPAYTDQLAAVTLVPSGSNGTVQLEFKHLLSRLTVKVATAEDDDSPVTLNSLDLWLQCEENTDKPRRRACYINTYTGKWEDDDIQLDDGPILREVGSTGETSYSLYERLAASSLGEWETDDTYLNQARAFFSDDALEDMNCKPYSGVSGSPYFQSASEDGVALCAEPLTPGPDLLIVPQGDKWITLLDIDYTYRGVQVRRERVPVALDLASGRHTTLVVTLTAPDIPMTFGTFSVDGWNATQSQNQSTAETGEAEDPGDGDQAQDPNDPGDGDQAQDPDGPADLD